MAVKDYSASPELNVSISGINIAEGCPPSGSNNAIRQLMADVKAERAAGKDLADEILGVKKPVVKKSAAPAEKEEN